ncbi:MAG: hypothetical protein KGO96_12830 [Elusimicrobia bacterium]|nr:hypothetical protein [Elusimicrobiota bacterium]
MIATRADFLRPCQRRFGELTLPFSGLTVRFRSLSELEFSQFEMDSLRASGDGDSFEPSDEAVRSTRARLIVLCLCDEGGVRILTSDDIESIECLDAGDTAALYDVLRDHCGLARRVTEAMARREAAKKNSNETDGGDSRSS